MNTLLRSDKRTSKHGKSGKEHKKVFFVFNPVSGRSQIRADLVDILEILAAKDYRITCYPTKYRGDAREAVRDREKDYSMVICAGGDGTLDEVVSGMMEDPDKPVIPIGYIPAGTTNDFAASLGIPSDMKEAAKIAVDGKIYECDLGYFNESIYYTYVAAFGIFTETSYQTPQDLKNQLGHLAYILQGMMDLGRARTYHFRVDSNEFSTADDFVFGMVSNSRSVGGFPDIAGDEVDMSDGMFEVTLVKMPMNILELNDIVQYFNRLSDTSDLVYRFKTSHIVFESNEPVNWTRDGEYGGTLKRVEIRSLHRKLKIMVPQNQQLPETANN